MEAILMTDHEEEKQVPDEIEHLKNQAADALEEAVRRLRDTDIRIEGEELLKIVHDAEGKLRHLAPEKLPDAGEIGEEIKKKIHEAEGALHKIAEDEKIMIEKEVKTVESFVADHPIAAIAIAAGSGFIVGLIAAKLR
jgi:ElaB/YqjD/DUF883 family membrane-anchored ribosome-binding protein